ncbi:MAG: hypothetical protein E7240_07455 [Lachnospiraceae bacterium]|nr:hypothetical protein [Lachnospiraceae bacterium]
MISLKADPSFAEKGLHFGIVEAFYPDSSKWDTEAFEALKEAELAQLREEMADYVRADVFGTHPYNRYFKKYKKTYPVLQQLESYLLKGRPFPSGNPINEVTFLTELRTRMLLGTHDFDCIHGDLVLFCPTEKIDFTGLRNETVHCYPGDVTGRDDDGIILSMIAGADARTCLHPESCHIAYLFFGAPGVTEEEMRNVQERLMGYARVLVPSIELHPQIY